MNYQDPKLDIAERLRQGKLILESVSNRNTRHRSYVWDKFSRIYDGEKRLDYVACRQCRWIYAHVEKHGTSSLIKHRCAASIYNPDYDLDEPFQNGTSPQPEPETVVIKSANYGDETSRHNDSTEDDFATLSRLITETYANQSGGDLDPDPAEETGSTRKMLEDRTLDKFLFGAPLAKKQCNLANRINHENLESADGDKEELESVVVPKNASKQNLEHLELRSRVEKHRAETQYWRVMKKKAELEVEKLILEQLKLRHQLEQLQQQKLAFPPSPEGASVREEGPDVEEDENEQQHVPSTSKVKQER